MIIEVIPRVDWQLNSILQWLINPVVNRWRYLFCLNFQRTLLANHCLFRIFKGIMHWEVQNICYWRSVALTAVRPNKLFLFIRKTLKNTFLRQILVNVRPFKLLFLIYAFLSKQHYFSLFLQLFVALVTQSFL